MHEQHFSENAWIENFALDVLAVTHLEINICNRINILAKLEGKIPQ